MLVCLRPCICTHVHMCAECVLRGHIWPWASFFTLYTLFFSHWACSQINCTDWSANPWVMPVLASLLMPLPKCEAVPGFCVSSGIKLRSSCLHSGSFTHWVSSLAPGSSCPHESRAIFLESWAFWKGDNQQAIDKGIWALLRTVGISPFPHRRTLLSPSLYSYFLFLVSLCSIQASLRF